MRRARPILLAAAAVALVALLAAGLRLWTIATLAESLRADLQTIEALASRPAGLEGLDTLAPVVARAAGTASALRAESAPLAPLARGLAWLPRYGADLAAAPALLDAAAELTSAADQGLAALRPALRDRAAGRPTGEALAEHLVAGRPRLRVARLSVERAAAALASVDLATLSPSLAGPARRARELLPAAADALDLALAAPDLLGADAPRDYLVLAQNPDELRATGGFITAAGVLTVERGRVTRLTLQDSALVDDLGRGPYPLAPDPIRRYMGGSPGEPLLWLFRDANWSPDFPTAAGQALDLYRAGRGEAPERVLAFTPAAVSELLAALGPLQVPGADAPVDSSSVLQFLRDAWSSDAGAAAEARKAYLATLAAAIVARAQAGGGDPLALAEAVGRALDRRDILIHAPGSPVAPLLARRGWDGAVRTGDADFLMVVGSNVGYNKANPTISQEVVYALDLSEPTAPRAAATVQLRSTLAGASACDQWDKPLAGAPRRYENRMVDCYWGYLRVLAAGGSELASAEVAPVPGSWMLSGQGDEGRVDAAVGEAGAQVFGALAVVPRGGERRVTFRYRLPPEVLTRDAAGWRYRLRVQRQPGLEQRVVVQVLLPAGAAAVESSIAPSDQSGGVLTFALDLDVDRELEIRFSDS